MAQIIKFPAQTTKFGYKPVKKRGKCAENPNQLHLFPQVSATILKLEQGLSRFEQALMLDERGDLRAEELYRQAIEEQDCIADAFCNLGILQSKQGQVTRAFDSFTTCLKHNPRHVEAHYNLGNMYFEANDFRLAQLHYQIAAEFDPSFANVYFNLALVLAINNELIAAVTALTTYRGLVSTEDARHADELLAKLKKSLRQKQ